MDANERKWFDIHRLSPGARRGAVKKPATTTNLGILSLSSPQSCCLLYLQDVKKKSHENFRFTRFYSPFVASERWAYMQQRDKFVSYRYRISFKTLVPLTAALVLLMGFFIIASVISLNKWEQVRSRCRADAQCAAYKELEGDVYTVELTEPSANEQIVHDELNAAREVLHSVWFNTDFSLYTSDRNNKCLHLPPPKWQPQKTQRPTTNNLIRNLRYELWADAIHFSGFAIKNPPNKKQEKRKPTLDSALFYASQFS